MAARTWNVLNEGKPFTVVFFLIVFALSGPSLGGLLAAAPLGLVWWRHPYPLHLRVALWAVAAGVVAGAGGVSFAVAALAVGLYLFFTVVLWGTLYYHLRLGAPWTNFARFSRLVLENPDPTSGNLFEQVPKVLALLALARSGQPCRPCGPWRWRHWWWASSSTADW